jgi:hypothetical protein
MDKELAHKLIEKYYTVKEVYVKCEEIAIELNSNIQPLNEFRAALDHIFRIIVSDYDYSVTIKPTIEEEANKLLGHLNRAYFDVCELLCSYFRLKICNCMDKFTVEDIREALPEYYTEIKPYIDSCEMDIANIRLRRGIEYGEEQENLFKEFKAIVDNLEKYYIKIIGDTNNIGAQKDLKKHKRNRYIFNGISISIGVIGIIVSIIFGVISCM